MSNTKKRCNQSELCSRNKRKKFKQKSGYCYARPMVWDHHRWNGPQLKRFCGVFLSNLFRFVQICSDLCADLLRVERYNCMLIISGQLVVELVKIGAPFILNFFFLSICSDHNRNIRLYWAGLVQNVRENFSKKWTSARNVIHCCKLAIGHMPAYGRLYADKPMFERL